MIAESPQLTKSRVWASSSWPRHAMRIVELVQVNFLDPCLWVGKTDDGRTLVIHGHARGFNSTLDIYLTSDKPHQNAAHISFSYPFRDAHFLRTPDVMRLLQPYLDGAPY